MRRHGTRAASPARTLERTIAAVPLRGARPAGMADDDGSRMGATSLVAKDHCPVHDRLLVGAEGIRLPIRRDLAVAPALIDQQDGLVRIAQRRRIAIAVLEHDPAAVPCGSLADARRTVGRLAHADDRTAADR